MSTTLTIHDETTSGQKTNTFTLDCLTERMTVRELIRARIYQEVQDYNRRTDTPTFRGLVQPTDAERDPKKTLHSSQLPKHREIDWKEQFEKAQTSFQRNSFFILIDDRQVEVAAGNP